MKVIRSTSGTKILVSDEDYDWIRVWNLVDNGHQIRINMYRTDYILARRILNVTDPNKIVDHINRRYRDNQRENLRESTRAENSQNMGMHRDNFSGRKGVTYRARNNDWKARIWVEDQEIHLGYFSTKEEAAKAYNKAALKYFGKFACLNKL